MQNNPLSARLIRLLQHIAIISAVFGIMLCFLIIINFLQTKKADPLNSKAMNTLVQRWQANPGDEQLKNEIRELDLLARKAFFTNQWQVQTGGLLLFASIVLVIICLQAIQLHRKKNPQIEPGKTENFFEKRKRSRKWIAGSGILLAGISFLLVFLTHHDLERELERTSKSSLTKGALLPGTMGNNGNPEAITGDSTKPSGNQTVSDFPDEQELISNYPSFRGPGGNGIAFQKNVPTDWDGKTGKNIRWKTAIPLPGYNSPIIWNDRIFLSGANETKRELYCFDANTGKLLWLTKAEKIPGSPVEVPKVNRETGFCAPSLTTDGRRVYAIFANGDIIAVDMDGKKVWEKNLGLPKNHYGHSSSLNIYRDNVIVQYDQSGNASVMALSGKSGEVMWKTNRDVRVSWSSPVVVNTGQRTEILLAADPYVASYDPGNGKELWRFSCISGEVGPSLAYADGIVFSVNEYSKLAAIRIGDQPRLLWEDTEYLSDVPSPVADKDYLFLCSSYGTFVCYEAKTGRKLWDKEFGKTVYASPILAGGNIFLMDSKGIMHIFKAGKTYEPVHDPVLGEGSFCTPAFAEGRIYIRGDKNLYCIGK